VSACGWQADEWIIDGSGRNTLEIGVLNDRRQGLFSHPAESRETREVTACTTPRNAQPGGSCTCLPVSIALAVTLGQSQAALLAIARAGLRPDLQRQQLPGSKADHLAQQKGRPQYTVKRLGQRVIAPSQLGFPAAQWSPAARLRAD